MNGIPKLFALVFGFVSKDRISALITLGIVAVLVGLALGSVYFGQQILKSDGDSFYKQEPSLRVVAPPISLEDSDGAVDVISVICANNAIPQVNFIVEWIRLSDGPVEDAIFAQVLRAPLDTDCTPVSTAVVIPSEVGPGMWQICITVDTGSEQRSHNSQPFEVKP